MLEFLLNHHAHNCFKSWLGIGKPGNKVSNFYFYELPL